MTSNAFIESIAAEYHRYKALCEGAMAQLPEDHLAEASATGNSIAAIAWHMAANLASRFTDFLTTDGEKPWRDREDEFARRKPTREELLAHWERGWGILFAALHELTDSDLSRDVKIRGVSLTVTEALHRSLAHAAYHAGQIVFIAKERRAADWKYLSIPPGGSSEYAKDPTREKAAAHARELGKG